MILKEHTLLFPRLFPFKVITILRKAILHCIEVIIINITKHYIKY